MGIDDVSANTIGGTAPGAGNVISGNGVAPREAHGIDILGEFANDNVVRGNLVGANAAGTTAVGNLGHGVLIEFGFDNVVGGSAADAGNLIGTDAAGTGAVANTGHGVHVISGLERRGGLMMRVSRPLTLLQPR